MSATLAALTAIGEAAQIIDAMSGLLAAAKMSGRELTIEEVEDARNGAIAAAAEATEAAKRAAAREAAAG